MAYASMKKLILNANAQFQSGNWTAEEYEAYKNQQMNKLDVFFAKGRITASQYDELTSLFIEVNAEA